MRDRVAAAIIRETITLLTGALEHVEPARARLRTWKESGFPAGGTSSGGTTGESHADPTLAAIQALETVDADKNHTGFRSLDPIGKGLAAMDDRVFKVRDLARKISADITAVIEVPESPGEEGCALCNAARLPAGHLCECDSDAEHNCVKDCKPKVCVCACLTRDHRHPASHQRIHARRGPRPEWAETDDDRVDDLARCQFHYEFATRYGVDAHHAITLWHLDHLGFRLPEALVREHHPAQYKARGQRRRPRQSDRVWLGGSQA